MKTMTPKEMEIRLAENEKIFNEDTSKIVLRNGYLGALYSGIATYKCLECKKIVDARDIICWHCGADVSHIEDYVRKVTK